MPSRIMIIDDDARICEILRDRLERMGYDSIIAYDGRTGLALMALERIRTPIAGVVLDVEMPIMNGIEVLRVLRSQYPEVPVLIMSPGPDFRMLEAAVRLGARGYILKPVDTAQFVRVCEQSFRSPDGDG